MAEAVNLKVEMLEFFCKGIVGKQSVAIGGYPDDASGIVYYVIAALPPTSGVYPVLRLHVLGFCTLP